MRVLDEWQAFVSKRAEDASEFGLVAERHLLAPTATEHGDLVPRDRLDAVAGHDRRLPGGRRRRRAVTDDRRALRSSGERIQTHQLAALRGDRSSAAVVLHQRNVTARECPSSDAASLCGCGVARAQRHNQRLRGAPTCRLVSAGVGPYWMIGTPGRR